MLRLTVTTRGERLASCISAEGRLVGDWTALLESECLALLGRGVPVELDLAGVNDIDSLGVSVLRRLRKEPVVVRGLSSIMLALLGEEPAQ